METNELEYTSQRMAVPAEFGEVFTHFYSAENKTGETIRKTLLPTFQTMMVFSFGSETTFVSQQNHQVTAGKCLIFGPVKHALEYSMSPGAEILGATFKDDAFYRFFGQPLLADQLPVNPDKLLNENCFANLWYLLKMTPAAERVAVILNFCKPYIRNRETAFAKFALYQDAAAAFNPIKVIAHESKQSERTVQLYQKKYFGYTAKEIGRYQRFRKAIELLQTNVTPPDWFEIVDACGYYDQSQLIHDFKHYLKLSPKQYLKFQRNICGNG